MSKIVLIRHGESEDNASNTFTGWIDTKLSKKGQIEAFHAAKDIQKLNINFSCAFASELNRCKETLEIILKNLEQEISTHFSWKLNVRHYGILQGKNKDEMRKKYGKLAVEQWRRGYDFTPPPAEEKSHLVDLKYYKNNFKNFQDQDLPYSESNKNSYKRNIDFFKHHISNKKGDILIVGHGSTVRALLMHLKKLDEVEASTLEIPTARPILIDLS